MKDELGGQIMKEFLGLRAKTYSYIKDNNNKDKKEKDTKKCVVKIKLRFEGYNCLDSLKKDQKEFIKNNKLILITQ